MFDLLNVLRAILNWNDDPEIDGTRRGIALVFLVLFLLLVVVCSGAIIAARQG